MSIYCLLNKDKYVVSFSKFYNPLLLIDVKKYNMKCNLTNSFLFFIENPRSNIELVSGFFEFYFKSIPQDFTLGQVISKTLITYSDTLYKSHEFMPCILFTTGLYLQEILIYLPFQNFPFHRQLKVHFIDKIFDKCSICLENKNCINVHQNKYNHFICSDCILYIDNTCPICRLSILE
jgi:hypothetical protein